MQNRAIIAPESARFYDRDGNVVLDVDGRKPTLRDARKNGWLPSFSTIKSCIAKPQLEMWKMENFARTMLATPRKDQEDDSAYIVRVHQETRKLLDVQADRGKELHKQIEEFFLSGREPTDDVARSSVLSVLEFAGEGATFVPEKSFANIEVGIGGTADLVVDYGDRSAILDFKTRDIKPDSKPYFTDGMQLGCYSIGIERRDALLVSVLIDRNTPDNTLFYTWGENWSKTGRGAASCAPSVLQASFLCAFEIWKTMNNYEPTEL